MNIKQISSEIKSMVSSLNESMNYSFGQLAKQLIDDVRSEVQMPLKYLEGEETETEGRASGFLGVEEVGNDGEPFPVGIRLEVIATGSKMKVRLSDPNGSALESFEGSGDRTDYDILIRNVVDFIRAQGLVR